MSRIAVALLVVLVGVSLACRCRLPTPKNAFCGADWVGVFKVIQKNSHPNDSLISYAVEVVKSFRALYGVPTVGSTNLLFTRDVSAACGIDNLQIGQKYLLAGTASNGLSMTSCAQFEWNLEWESVPDEVKTALEQGSYQPCV